MTAVPPSMTPGSQAGIGQASAHFKWMALHDVANVVATMAGLEPGPEMAVLDFQVVMRNAAPWRREFVERGIDDMAAAMEPGLSALLGIEARGADPVGAARGLWREFTEARAAILALSPLATA